MVKRVELPNGQTAEVPDDASEEEILQIANQVMEQQPQTEAEATELDLGAGVRESALSIGTGGLAQIPAGISGLISLGIAVLPPPDEQDKGLFSNIYSAIRGDGDPLEIAARRVGTVQDALTFQPRTDEGKILLDQIDRTVVEPLASKIRAVSDATFRQFGPEAATAVRTMLEGGEALLTRRPQRLPQVAETEARLEGLEIDPNIAPRARREQITDAAKRGSAEVRGEFTDRIVEAVQVARQEAKNQVDQLYEQARAFDAGVDVGRMRDLPTYMRQSLETFDVEDMTTVSKRLDEMQQIIENTPEDSAVRLNTLEKWRQRVNANRPKNVEGQPTPEGAANDILKAQYDEWRENLFLSDMVSGSESAIRKWKEASAASAEFKRRFNEDSVLRKMATQELTPEESRRLIFGGGQTGFKPESARIIARMKEILGKESPEIAALQAEAALNIMDPLLRVEPNFKQFVVNFDKVMKNNDTVINELFVEDQIKNMRILRDAADATRKEAPDLRRLDFDRAAAVFLSRSEGASFAKAQLRIGLGARIINTLRRAGSKGNRREMLGKMLGYDPGANLLSRLGPTLGAIRSGQIDKDEDPPGSETREQ